MLFGVRKGKYAKTARQRTKKIESEGKRKDDLDLLGNKDAGAGRIDDLGVNITNLVAR